MRVSLLSVTPVKSLAVHHPEHVDLGPGGVIGDREFFLIDEDGSLATCARLGALLRYRADFDADAGLLEVHGPDGLVRSGAVDRGEAVATDFFGLRTVGGHVVDGWEAVFSEIAGCPLRLVRGTSGGFDVGGVTLLGSPTVAALAGKPDAAPVDSRRFRMNIEIAGGEPLDEDGWKDAHLRVGAAIVRVGGPVRRCAATTRNPDSGVVDLRTLEMIGRFRGRQETSEFGAGFYLGVYAEVVEPGPVRIGDAVAVVT